MTKQPTSLIQMFAERAKRLYSPGGVAMEVLKLSHNPEVDAKQLTRQIACDPALAARILKVVNSSLFATRESVSDLDQAVALLGVKTLRMLVLGFAIPDSLYDSKYADALSTYWRFTAIKAIACKAILEIIWRKPSDEALVAGLLHDLGSLVLLNEVGADYAEFLCTARGDGSEINALENRILGFEHIVLSARLLHHWGLPNNLTQPIGMPLDADRLAKLPEAAAELPQALHLADLAARFLMQREPKLLRELMQTAKRYRNATAVQVERIVDVINDAEPALLKIFEQTPGGEDYAAVLSQAQAELKSTEDAVIHHEFREHERPSFTRLLDRANRLRAELQSEATEQAQAANEGLALNETASRSSDSSMASEPDSTTLPSTPASGFAALKQTSTPGASLTVETATMEEQQVEALVRDVTLTSRLEQWLLRARRNQAPVSLMLLECDLSRVAEGLREFVARRVNDLIAYEMRETAAKLSPEGVAYVAAIERMEAVKLARQLLAQLENDSHCALAVLKIAIASIDHPPPNFPADDWRDAAVRCLYGARCAGGHAIKSIDAV